MTFDLGPETAAPYFAERGVLDSEDATAESLGGGVSNVVVRVRSDVDCLVAKQPLPNLAVEDDWPADVSRVHNEAAAIRTYESVLAEVDLDARVPAVRYESEADHVVAIDCAPGSATMWKRELLDGRVDREVAAAVGEALGAVHDAAAGDPDRRREFESRAPFEQLRLDPYHRTTAERHPDVAGEIEAEIERIEGVGRTLVHGDYSPKNVLVARDGDETVPWLLDFEVAHWGDPAFDAAFMLNHLLIKSVHNAARHGAYADAARTFWRAYDERVEWDCERETVRELGVLMLARVDGKSPVEYVDDATAETLRDVAKRLLRSDVGTLDGAAAQVREVCEPCA
jgi:aminoglycoside phosphotransferase (APT) family kinase protein